MKKQSKVKAKLSNIACIYIVVMIILVLTVAYAIFKYITFMQNTSTQQCFSQL